MKRVGFITSPLVSGHAGRGVGFYTRHLLDHLRLQASEFDMEIIEIGNVSQLSIHNCQLIHFPFFDLFYPSLPLVKAFPTVVTVHDVIPLEFPDYYPSGVRGWLNLQRQKFALTGVDRVITDSYASVQSIHKFLPVSHSRIKLVPLAADSHFKPLSRPKNTYHLPKKFVLYVGGINYNKNLPTLITACRQISIPLVVVGKEAAAVEKLDLTHPELRHLRSVDWTGVIRLDFVENMTDIYNLASVYCQPSFAEGFGFPVLEALSCGTPVVASDILALHEIAVDNAVYFDPADPAVTAQTLLRVLSDADLRKSLSRSGPEIARRFSWTNTAQQTLMVYEEVLR